MFFHDCDIEKMVPIFLIVSAVAPVLFGGFAKRKLDEDDCCGVGTICGIIGFLFSLTWLIAGMISEKKIYGRWPGGVGWRLGVTQTFSR